MNNSKILDAGSLMLASPNGVCYISANLNSLPKSQLNTLKQLLENKNVFISKQNHKLKSNNKNKLKNFELDQTEFHIEEFDINCSICAFNEFLDSKSKFDEEQLIK